MTEEQARQRFMILNLVRLASLAIVLAGVANISGAFLPDLSPMLGTVLLVAGAADFFFAPVLLKRAWRGRDR
jgi:hypothetical protein